MWSQVWKMFSTGEIWLVNTPLLLAESLERKREGTPMFSISIVNLTWWRGFSELLTHQSKKYLGSRRWLCLRRRSLAVVGDSFLVLAGLPSSPVVLGCLSALSTAHSCFYMSFQRAFISVSSRYSARGIVTVSSSSSSSPPLAHHPSRTGMCWLQPPPPPTARSPVDLPLLPPSLGGPPGSLVIY